LPADRRFFHGRRLDGQGRRAELFKVALMVMVGGAIGALGRHFIGVGMGLWLGPGVPYFATLLVNIAGCFAVGALTEAFALVWSVSHEARAMLVVGLLGAFTTFSAFALDVFYLAERGGWLIAGGYVGISVIVSLYAFFLGLSLMRLVLT
jgi:CrcB protein